MPHMTDIDGALFEQLRPRLKAISCRIVGNDAEAEEIVQDCFFKWRGAEQAALATPAAWLTTVVQHQSIDRLRQRARDMAAARTALELTPDVSPALPEDGLLRRAEVSDALARLLTCLSPSERLALVLHEVFEYSHADIAAVLGSNTVNARQYLARARRRLRESEHTAPASEKLCRELTRRFQAALNGVDLPAMLALLSEEQPVSLHPSPPLRIRAVAVTVTDTVANDASYRLAVSA